jgi:hypothetical protein
MPLLYGFQMRFPRQIAGDVLGREVAGGEGCVSAAPNRCGDGLRPSQPGSPGIAAAGAAYQPFAVASGRIPLHDVERAPDAATVGTLEHVSADHGGLHVRMAQGSWIVRMS